MAVRAKCSTVGVAVSPNRSPQEIGSPGDGDNPLTVSRGATRKNSCYSPSCSWSLCLSFPRCHLGYTPISTTVWKLRRLILLGFLATHLVRPYLSGGLLPLVSGWLGLPLGVIKFLFFSGCDDMGWRRESDCAFQRDKRLEDFSRLFE